MKKTGIYTGLLLAMFVFTNVQAQTEKVKATPEERHERKLEHLKKELNLNEEQAKKIDVLDIEYKPKIKEANEQLQKAHKNKEALVLELDAKIKEMLSNEQKTKYEELKKKEKERRKNNHNKPEKEIE